jgi:hypothetical protein
MRENDDQADIIKSIKAESGYAKKWATPYTVGVPDLVGSLPSVGCFLMEVKKPGKQPTPKQAYELKQYQDAGGLVLLCHAYRKHHLHIKLFGQVLGLTCLWNPPNQVYMGLNRIVGFVKW